MTAWTCPACGRQFGRVGQGHECSPAMSLEEYFATGPERERPIFEVVFAHLDSLGPVHVEPVSVGIFFKRGRRIAELRPMRDWEALSIGLSHQVSHPLIRRKVVPYSGRYFHTFNVRTPDEIDEEILEWLTEAYLDAAD